MKTVSIIGIGRIGGGLAIALAHKGCKIENLFTQNPEKTVKVSDKLSQNPRILTIEQANLIESEIIFITTPDADIERTAEVLSRKLNIQPFVFHTSGALSSEVLGDLKKRGCPVGSIHPLVSVSDMFLAEKRFYNAYFAIEGDLRAVKIAEKIVADLGGKPFSIETKYKTLYHAAAVTACGHLVAVVDIAIEMLGKCGLDQENAKQILLPLIKSTVENLETQTTAEALTGTFARADVETLKNHVDAIEKNLSPEILEIYAQLGLRSLPLAKKQGADDEHLEKMREELLIAKNKSRC